MPPRMTFLLLCLSLLYPAETTLLLVLHLLTDSTSLLFCTTLYFNFLLCICFCRRFCSISIFYVSFVYVLLWSASFCKCSYLFCAG